ncbi:MAG: ATP-binding protein [Nostoc sp. DedQUE08]|uniref:ATP-binding protein n=1 Tax=Nostoc sp. DedQUE08 TaxID=3075393 RepID=UPI002AD56EB5|nr:ATP-binding protein [Nostoc sp. DedQUE08]MDZ8065640.1 ATP-binding protein [Nostoc sp. DedQUE08]
MDSQKALTFINKLLANDKQVLNDLEQKLFLGMWEGKEYAEIVNDGFYSTQYVRDVGAKLCTKITELLGIQVKKRIFKNSIIAGYQKFSEQASLSQEPIVELTNPPLRDESHSANLLPQNYNPFIPQHGRIEDPQQFFSREREISRVFEVLNSNSSVALIGEEGIGKSSLLWVICQQAENYLQLPREPVFLNLNNGVHDEDEFYIALCDKIGIPESKGYRLTRNLQKKKVLLAIDNLGKLIENGFTRQVRDQLRGLAEGRDASLRLILAASEPLNKLFNDSQDNGKTSPLAGICQEEHIHPWDEATMCAFITNRLARTSVKLTEDKIIQLIQESGGHPRKLMQLCYKTYSQYVESVQ